jgi:hypothetical protein
MKADGGALLYIIIGIISLIVSAISKSKKKAARPYAPEYSKEETPHPQPEPQATWQKELEDIFGKVFDEPEVVETKPQYNQPTKAEVIDEPISPYVEALNKYAQTKQGASAEPKIYDPIKEPVYAEEETELASIHLNRSELSKAIIYSEIINRKYF